MSMEDEERLGTEKNRQIRKEKVLGSSGERRDPPKKTFSKLPGSGTRKMLRRGREHR